MQRCRYGTSLAQKLITRLTRKANVDSTVCVDKNTLTVCRPEGCPNADDPNVHKTGSQGPRAAFAHPWAALEQMSLVDTA